MEALLFVLILLLNVGIAWWNARVCGQSWVESKHLGGWIRLVVWSAAIQSVIGFSMAYLVVFGGIAFLFGWLPPSAIQWVASLFYLAIIVPALGTGLIITIHSWQVALRERSLLNMGTAAYNTFAIAHNAYQAVDGIGQSIGVVGEMMSSVLSSDGDAKGKLALLVLLLVICALLAGVYTTAVLIQRYAGTVAIPERPDTSVSRPWSRTA